MKTCTNLNLNNAPVLSCAHYFQAPATQARTLSIYSSDKNFNFVGAAYSHLRFINLRGAPSCRLLIKSFSNKLKTISTIKYILTIYD